MNPATKNFIGKPAPAGYIAGLGRGATGFTTRSDIGPARETSQAALAHQHREAQEADEERFADDPDNETGLFNSLPYEADDEEADKIYASIDDALGQRRAKHREVKEKLLKAKLAVERPKITEQFADAKRELSHLSTTDWEGIPEVTNMSRRKTKKDLGRERFVPVPDSILSGARTKVESSATVNDTSKLTTSTPGGIHTDFVEMGVARDRVLGVKLDQVSDSVTGQTVIDPKGYLTDLNLMIPKNDADIGDIKKTRMLLTSLTKTNPGHAPAWIAAARFEEMTGNLVNSRTLIEQGCQHCPKKEDVWLEAARLNAIDNAKIILANAVRHVPDSVKVWLHASRLESEAVAQKRVLRRALEFIPNSVTLWRSAIALEEVQEDAVVLVRRAVECVPLSVDMWLTLAKLETHENARKVLNKARKTIPTSHEIWIAAAMLEEAQGLTDNVSAIISRGIEALDSKGHSLARDKWLEEAIKCEEQGAVSTCQAIVKNTIGEGLEPEDCKTVWTSDAENCLANNHIETARAIYAYAVLQFPTKRSLWEGAAFLELKHGSSQSLLLLLDEAVSHVPHAESLWLMAAKTKWTQVGDLDDARATLAKAFKANPTSSKIWLAAVKLEQENGEYAKAQQFLTHARAKAGTEPKVWMKSAVLERIVNNLPRAIELVKQAVDRFPTFWKLWLIWAQVEQQLGNVAAARDVYSNAVKRVPNCIPAWISASRLEESSGVVYRARAVLDRARLVNPQNVLLWQESIQLEVRAGNTAMAKSQLSRALQDCTADGRLWALSILLEQRTQRRAKCMDALKACGESDPYVVLTVARVFWSERKLDKARAWLVRATKANADSGDAWAYLYRFEVEHGTSPQQELVIEQFLAADPHHGDLWPALLKDIANVRIAKELLLKTLAMEVAVTL